MLLLIKKREAPWMEQVATWSSWSDALPDLVSFSDVERWRGREEAYLFGKMVWARPLWAVSVRWARCNIPRVTP